MKFIFEYLKLLKKKELRKDAPKPIVWDSGSQSNPNPTTSLRIRRAPLPQTTSSSSVNQESQPQQTQTPTQRQNLVQSQFRLQASQILNQGVNFSTSSFAENTQLQQNQQILSQQRLLLNQQRTLIRTPRAPLQPQTPQSGQTQQQQQQTTRATLNPGRGSTPLISGTQPIRRGGGVSGPGNTSTRGRGNI